MGIKLSCLRLHVLKYFVSSFNIKTNKMANIIMKLYTLKAYHYFFLE